MTVEKTGVYNEIKSHCAYLMHHNKVIKQKKDLNKKDLEILKFYGMDNEKSVINFINNLNKAQMEELIPQFRDKIRENFKDEIAKQLKEKEKTMKQIAATTNNPIEELTKTLEEDLINELEEELKKKLMEEFSRPATSNKWALPQKPKKSSPLSPQDLKKFFTRSFAAAVSDSLSSLSKEKSLTVHTEIAIELVKHINESSIDSFESKCKKLMNDETSSLRKKFNENNKEIQSYYDRSKEYGETLLKLTGNEKLIKKTHREIITSQKDSASLDPHIIKFDIDSILKNALALKKTVSYCENNLKSEFNSHKIIDPNTYFESLARELGSDFSAQFPMQENKKQLLVAALKIAHANLQPKTTSEASFKTSSINSSSTLPSEDNNKTNIGRINNSKQRLRSKTEKIKHLSDKTSSEIEQRLLSIRTKISNKKNISALKKTRKYVNPFSSSHQATATTSLSEEEQIAKKYNISKKDWDILKIYDFDNEERIINLKNVFNGQTQARTEMLFKAYLPSFKSGAHSENMNKVMQVNRSLAAKLVTEFPNIKLIDNIDISSYMEKIPEKQKSDILKSYAGYFQKEHLIEKNERAFGLAFANLTGKFKVKGKYSIYNKSLTDDQVKERTSKEAVHVIRFFNDAKKMIPACEELMRFLKSDPNLLTQDIFDSEGYVKKEVAEYLQKREPNIYDYLLEVPQEQRLLMGELLQSIHLIDIRDDYFKDKDLTLYKPYLKGINDNFFLLQILSQEIYNKEKSKYAAVNNPIEKNITFGSENIKDSYTDQTTLSPTSISDAPPQKNLSENIRDSYTDQTTLSPTSISDAPPQKNLVMGWNKTTSKPLDFEDISTTQQLSVKKLHHFAVSNQKEYHIQEVKKLPEKSSKMTGIEIKFESDNPKKNPVSVYIYNDKDQNTKFSMSKNLLKNDQDSAREATLKICRLAVNASEPNASFHIPDTLSDNKRAMVSECFAQAINEALHKPNSKFNEKTIPKITSSTSYTSKHQLK